MNFFRFFFDPKITRHFLPYLTKIEMVLITKRLSLSDQKLSGSEPWISQNPTFWKVWQFQKKKRFFKDKKVCKIFYLMFLKLWRSEPMVLSKSIGSILLSHENFIIYISKTKNPKNLNLS